MHKEQVGWHCWWNAWQIETHLLGWEACYT